MSSAKQEFNYCDLKNIIKGAHFFACGGGGALENGEELLEELKKQFDSEDDIRIQYLNSDDLTDAQTLPVLAAMGAPQQFLKKGYSHSPITAFEVLEKIRKLEFSTLSPVETGPIAYGMSLLVAAHKRIPIMNGDGGGRAFPSLQLSTFANTALEEPIAVGPCALTSEKTLRDDGGAIIIECKSSVDVDAMTRGIISMSSSFDERASLASFAMTGKQLKQTNAFVPGMMTTSLELGRRISDCQAKKESCFPVIEDLPGAICHLKGKLTNITSKTAGGFDSVVMEFTDVNGVQCFVMSKNENLLLWSDTASSPQAMAPDLICCISSDATLMSNDEVLAAWQNNPEDHRLQEMAIFSLPAKEQIQQPWFHEQFAEVFRNHNYYGCYHPPIAPKTEY